MNHSTSMLPLPHLNLLVHLLGVFAGQAPCAFSGSQPGVQLGLLGCPGSQWLAHLAVPMESQWTHTCNHLHQQQSPHHHQHRTTPHRPSRMCLIINETLHKHFINTWDLPQTFCCIILTAKFSKVPTVLWKLTKFSKSQVPLKAGGPQAAKYPNRQLPHTYSAHSSPARAWHWVPMRPHWATGWAVLMGCTTDWCSVWQDPWLLHTAFYFPGHLWRKKKTRLEFQKNFCT